MRLCWIWGQENEVLASADLFFFKKRQGHSTAASLVITAFPTLFYFEKFQNCGRAELCEYT